jgi:hypothetical protein
LAFSASFFDTRRISLVEVWMLLLAGFFVGRLLVVRLPAGVADDADDKNFFKEKPFASHTAMAAWVNVLFLTKPPGAYALSSLVQVSKSRTSTFLPSSPFLSVRWDRGITIWLCLTFVRRQNTTF